MTAINPANRGPRQRETKTLVQNRQATWLYAIEDTLEAGIILEGWEVKAILKGQATFNSGSAYVKLRDGRAYLASVTITPLKQSNQGLLHELNPLRERELLLKKAEFLKLERKCKTKGATVVPLALTCGSKIKVQIGVARGKKLADKRQALKDRDQDRETAREVRAIPVV